MMHGASEGRTRQGIDPENKGITQIGLGGSGRMGPSLANSIWQMEQIVRAGPWLRIGGRRRRQRPGAFFQTRRGSGRVFLSDGQSGIALEFATPVPVGPKMPS